MSGARSGFNRRWWWSFARFAREFDAWKASQPISAEQRRDDAALDRLGMAHEIAAMPCVMCEIDEPHACERAWYAQQIAHNEGRECADDECMCHAAAELLREGAALRPVSWLDIRRT